LRIFPKRLRISLFEEMKIIRRNRKNKIKKNSFFKLLKNRKNWKKDNKPRRLPRYKVKEFERKFLK